MIETFQRAEVLMQILSHAQEVGENCIVDYKVNPHNKNKDCELYKDILALLNAYDRPDEDRWLIYGVANAQQQPVGFMLEHDDLLDDADYQQKFRKIAPRPRIEFFTIPAEKVLGAKGVGRLFGAFYIPSENFGRIYELMATVKDKCPDKQGNFTQYQPGTSFVRNGSSTEPLIEEHRIKIRELAARAIVPATALGLDYVRTMPNSTLDGIRLLGGWDENNEEDKEKVGLICNKTYPEVLHDLAPEFDVGTFESRGSVISIRDREGVFSGVAQHLTKAALDELKEPFSSILRSVNHAYDLHEEERLLAGIRNVDQGCSKIARMGVATCCALMLRDASALRNCSNRDVELFANAMLASVLLSDDWRVFASNDDVLPILAQALPGSYLGLLQRGLRGGGAIREFLKQRSGGLVSVGLGSGLILGIQYAAMRGEYLSKAITVLADLLPFTNYAKDAIVTALLPWLPLTGAPVQSRKGLGNYLARQSEEGAWKALLELLPGETSSIARPPLPEFLKVDNLPESVDKAEYWDVSKEYCRCALRGMPASLERMTQVASRLRCFRVAGLIDEFGEAFQKRSAQLSDCERYPIWCEILRYVDRSARYPQSNWSATSEELTTLEQLAKAIAPRDDYYTALRVCSLTDADLVDRSDDWERVHDSALKQRVEALRSLEGRLHSSIDKLLMDGAKDSLLGEALACLTIDEVDRMQILERLGSSAIDGSQRVAASFVVTLLRDSGWPAIDALPLQELSAMCIARLFASLPLTPETWTRAESQLGEDSHLFWEQLSDCGVVYKADEGEYCVKSLLAAGHRGLAIETLQYAMEHGSQPSPILVKSAIESVTPSDMNSFVMYSIKCLLKYLEQASPDDQLLALEFYYSALLEERPDAYLFGQMSVRPEVFLDVIAIAYGSPDDDSGKATKDTRWATRRQVLRHWIVTPGVNGGVFDEKAFEEWTASVRSGAEVAGLLDWAEYEIGRNLFYAEKECGGSLPPQPVLRFLESSSDALEGYGMETINSRGAHFVDETGKEEDEIADSYQQQALDAEALGYARFASMLLDVSRDYRHEAEENRLRD